MSTIRDILTNSETGLLPYLEGILSASFGSFQVRPYGFGSSNTAGFRLREVTSSILRPDSLAVEQSVLVGQVITVANAAESQLLAAELQQQLDSAIAHWSEYCCPDLQRPVQSFSGTIVTQQDKNLASGSAGAWHCIVVRSFELIFNA